MRVGIADGELGYLLEQIVAHGVDHVLRELGGHHVHHEIQCGIDKEKDPHHQKDTQKAKRFAVATEIFARAEMDMEFGVGLDVFKCLAVLFVIINDLVGGLVVVDGLDGIDGVALKQGAEQVDEADQQRDDKQQDQDRSQNTQSDDPWPFSLFSCFFKFRNL